MPSLHHLLFVLLPVALTVRLYVGPRPDSLVMAEGVLRFCLGIGKWVLLAAPLWHLALVVAHGGPDSLGTSIAWMGFLGTLLSLHFACTGAGDVLAGLGGMFGFTVPDSIQDTLSLRRPTAGKWYWHLALLLAATVIVLIWQTGSWKDAWLHLQSLYEPPRQTYATLLQQTRVRTDFHVLTIIAGLACLYGMPHSRDFLRVGAPWKATACLVTFFLAMAMLWTHAAPTP